MTVASWPGRIGLSLSGYEVVDAALASTSVSPVELAYTLKRLLQVDSQPAGARILIDGRDTGLVTPASLPVEEPYPEGVDLQLDGHRPIREPVTREVVAAGRLWVKLSPVSDPIGAAAAVRIDSSGRGQPDRFVPVRGHRLRDGIASRAIACVAGDGPVHASAASV